MSLGGVYQDLQLRVRLDYSLLNVYIFFLIKYLVSLLRLTLFQIPRAMNMESYKAKLLGNENYRGKKKKAQSVMLKGFRERYPAGQETL